MADSVDSFFEGLDDAEEIPAPEAPAPEAPAEPAQPAAKAAEPADKPTDKPAEKPAEAPAEDAARAASSTEKPANPAPLAPTDKPADIQPDPKKWVPVGSHIELRNRLRALEEENSRLKNPPAAPAPKQPDPDFVQDPKGYVDHRFQAALDKLEEAVKPVTQTAEQAAQQAAQTQFFHTLNTAEQHFVSQQPDYYNALAHLRNLRASEISMLNPGISQEQIGEVMRNEELALAANILRSGRNPSEVAYALAKTRGYSPPKPPEPPKPSEPRPAPAEEVAKLVPKVPETPKLAPDLTLGTGTGSPAATDDVEDPFDAAFKEVFGRKRA